MLGRKQSVRNNEDWKNALDHIEETVSKKELDSLVKKTVKDIKEKCKGKKAAYAWSAGKDSLVLGEICEKAGIDQSVLVRCNLEYPAFIAWIEQNKPSGLEIINTGQDMEWLKKHPDMLFPDKSNKAAQWFHIVQHRGQARYYKEHQLEILLLGRRKADGNYVGKDNIYTNSAGITRYSPLAEWRHEDILAYIHYYDVKLPPMAFSVLCIISLALHVLQGHSHSRSSHTRLYSVPSWFLLEIHVRTFPVLLIPLLFSSASASSLTFNAKWLSEFID